MKPGDILATTGNKFIQISTISRWSHVGIYLDKDTILEATPGKVGKRNIKESLSSAQSATCLERPIPLDSTQQQALWDLANKIDSDNLKYAWLRAGYSGMPQFLRNILISISVLSLLLSLYVCISFGFRNELWALLSISLISVFIGLPIAKLTGKTKQVNECIESAEIKYSKNLSFLKTNLKPQYCSQLVYEVDQKILPSFSNDCTNVQELRPKDVVIACEKQGWLKTKVK
ncbi:MULTISPECIES: hypothetical protein [Vibrio harveyi group]|uniref:hypothetical protein n=1 Tax=Vibrio harveyi group TaxID=717610 RepID=UPI000CE95973|nr:hypothetical protein [Vibrio alginolyticus]AVF66074.1 hypothetical protein AL541_17835 [Vibrio alginolyticus]